MSLATTRNRYEVVAKLAETETSELFVARIGGADASQLVVLKRLHVEVASDVDKVRTFLARTRLAMQLDHPNVARIIEVGKLGASYFAAAEFVDGVNLRAIIAHARWKKTPIPLGIVLALAVGAIAGIDHAHSKKNRDGAVLGIVHGDISTGTFVVGRDGVVKLVGFGLVPDPKVDRAKDLAAFGAVLWELIVLEPADEDGDQQPPSDSRLDVPKELDDIVQKLLARDADERFASAAEVLAALEQLAAKLEQPIVAADVGRAMRLWFDDAPSSDSPPEPVVVETEVVPQDLASGTTIGEVDRLLEAVRIDAGAIRAAVVAANAVKPTVPATVVAGEAEQIERHASFLDVRDRIMANARPRPDSASLRPLVPIDPNAPPTTRKRPPTLQPAPPAWIPDVGAALAATPTRPPAEMSDPAISIDGPTVLSRDGLEDTDVHVGGMPDRAAVDLHSGRRFIASGDVGRVESEPVVSAFPPKADPLADTDRQKGERAAPRDTAEVDAGVGFESTAQVNIDDAIAKIEAIPPPELSIWDAPTEPTPPPTSITYGSPAVETSAKRPAAVARSSPAVDTGAPSRPSARLSPKLAPKRAGDEPAPRSWLVPALAVIFAIGALASVLILRYKHRAANHSATAANAPADGPTQIAAGADAGDGPVAIVVDAGAAPNPPLADAGVPVLHVVRHVDGGVTPPPTPPRPVDDLHAIDALSAAGSHAKVVALCERTKLDTAHVATCAIAACRVHSAHQAKGWLDALPETARAAVIDGCHAAGVYLERMPAPAAPAPGGPG